MEPIEGKSGKNCIAEHLEHNKLSAFVRHNVVQTSSTDEKPEPAKKLQKPCLPNSSFDENPFMNITETKLKKRRKIQSKLTYLKERNNKIKKSTLSVNAAGVGDNSQQLKNPTDSEDACSSSVHALESESSSEVSSEALMNNTQKPIYMCPLCWKRFEKQDSQMSHMKSCAAKHNLTLNNLLDALDLQAKQFQERKALGLPSLSTSSSTKKNVRKSSNSAHGVDPDLQLGLALSVSMREIEEQNLLKEQEIMMEAGLGEEVLSKQASLLERFGFTNSRPVLAAAQSRARTGKLKLKGTPLLMSRSQEERERLITEKVAIILMGEEEKKSQSQTTLFQLSAVCCDLQSSILSELLNKECILWKKASASPNDECDGYYVESLSKLISPSKVKAGSKLKHLSQVPCRIKTPVKNYFVTSKNAEVNTLKISSRLSDNELSRHDSGQKYSTNFLSSVQGDNVNKTTISPSFSEVLENDDEFIKKFSNDWKLLLNNSYMSDISIQVKDGKQICAHRLVLYLRCPRMLHDMAQETDSPKISIKLIKWSDISFKSAIAFLEYVYCGKVSSILRSKDCLYEILLLVEKYQVEELHRCLTSTIVMKRETSTQMLVSKNSASDNSDIQKPESFDLLETQHNSQSLLMSPYKSPSKNSRNWETMLAENKKSSFGGCLQSNNASELVYCGEGNFAPNKTVSSPDPFSEECDEVCVSSENELKNVSQSSQQNMDCLLEILDDDASVKLNCSPSQMHGGVESPITCELYKTKITEGKALRRNNLLDISSTEKRKFADCDHEPDKKRICISDRNSVRISLLHRFTEEDGKDQVNSKDIIELDLTQSSGNSGVECDHHSPLVPMSSENENEIVVQRNDDERLEEKSSDNESHDRLTDKSREESCDRDYKNKNNCHIKDNEVQNRDSDLGDLCADYEYNNFYANYSDYGGEVLDEGNSYDKKLAKMSPEVEQAYWRKASLHVSPRISPEELSCDKRRSSKKHTLSRTRSNPDISSTPINTSPSSPIFIKCLSQTSIHLKKSCVVYPEEPNKHVACIDEGDYNDVEVNISHKIPSPQTPPTPNSHTSRTSSRSVNSIKHLLEDSFTDELGRSSLWRDNIINSNDSKRGGCSTSIQEERRNSEASTPLPKNVPEENSITPLADYSIMKTPVLKKELQKYGLKPLKRKQAKLILRHIYNELHPWVPAQRSNEYELVSPETNKKSASSSNRHTRSVEKKHRKNPSVPPKNSPQKKSSTATQVDDADVSDENDSSLPSTQESSSSSLNEFEVPEDLAEDTSSAQTDMTELPVILHNFITNNPVFHQQVLLYEPIWLEELQEALKAKNYKFKLEHLMEYLDEQCITFRTLQGKGGRRHKNKTKTKQKPTAKSPS